MEVQNACGRNIGAVNTSVTVAMIGLSEGYRKCARAVYVDCHPPRVGIHIHIYCYIVNTTNGDNRQQNLWHSARSLAKV